MLRLQDYDFEIIYKEGSKNTAADCLSRRSYPPTEQQVMEKDSMQVVNDDIPDPREIIEVTFEYYPEAVANLHTTDITFFFIRLWYKWYKMPSNIIHWLAS
jgi:enoyl reductase-like protein